ncbi:hypothetical protein AQUCO_00700062v1 [Aquilegia coerulea]|uniref:ZF-HD dimerization-type domain-containing protein n=1 Tax=Aquilegia coerulea TaxID=218851 RepID=A0A2G5EIB0_AQUCA|nr:hypothetical protein AQUCO_00700062v1 [Aquilegia coerulea]
MEMGSGSSTTVTYKECQKNHTISLGSYIKDGCLAFMPNHAKENGLFCHACGCHRSFHREEKLKIISEDDAENVLPVNFDARRCDQGSVKKELSSNTDANLEDVIDISDDEQVDRVITPESVSKRTMSTTKAKKRRFREEEVRKLNTVCELLDYKSPGKYGKGADRVKRLCQEIGISRDSFRHYLNRRREFRGTSRI